MYLCFSHKKGVSSHQLARDLGITQKTAWFILHRIRSFVGKNASEMLLENMVEADETYIGGKEKNKHKSKKRDLKSTTIGERRKIKSGKPNEFDAKATVLGAVQRDGKVVTKFVPSAKTNTIHPFLLKHVKEGSRLITDEFYAYASLDTVFKHESVKHMIKEYVRGDVYSNTIENYWSVLKRGIYGTYHQVSKKHIQKYLDEFSFKYSTRENTEQERFDIALASCEGILKYPQLIQRNQK